MGRKRIIDQQEVLNAAERVIARLGAANLTLDAVAAEAGVSKASVLYDYKSKQALLEAIVGRAFEADKRAHAQAEALIADEESPSIRSRILVAREPPAEGYRAIALNLTAALALDGALRQQMKANQTAVIDHIARSARNPNGALLAYLALEGLKFLEYLDFHQFDPVTRARLIRQINGLVDTEPVERPLPEQ
jgi:AcrR family transcriptional regulator